MLELPLQGALLIGCYIPRAVPWAVEYIGLSARIVWVLKHPNVFSVYRRICFPSGTMCHCFKFRKSRRELALIKAFSEFKASRRPGKHIRCFKCFCQNRQFKTQNSKLKTVFYPFLPLFFYLFTPFYPSFFLVSKDFCCKFAPTKRLITLIKTI